jgi:hypothetical protein
MKKGMKEKTIRFHQKALEFDPVNANIRNIIDNLKRKQLFL